MRSGELGRALAALSALALAFAIAACGGGSKSAGPANEVDKAFAREMISHHRLAVQMAEIAKRASDHPAVKALAEKIVSAQTSEIDEINGIGNDIAAYDFSAASGGSGMQMGGMHGDTSKGPGMAADAATLGIPMSAMGMTMTVRELRRSSPFDRAFIEMMVAHHRGAIRMATVELARGKNEKLRSIASRIVDAQTREIKLMSTWFSRWYGRQAG